MTVMPHVRRYRVAMVLMLALSASVLCGCQNTRRNHAKWVQQANHRYAKMRSGMMLGMAQQQFDSGDLDQAEKSVRNATAVDPDNAKLRLLAGRIALERGRLERSYRLLGQAIHLSPKLPDARYYQGVVLQRWRRFAQARQRYAQAYHLQPDDVGYLLAMAEMMVNTSQNARALTLLESKANYFDQSAALRTAIGHLYRMQNQPGKAIPYFEQAALLAPDSAKAKEDLATACFAAGRMDKAIRGLKELLKSSRMASRVDLRRTLAAAYVKTDRVKQARQVYLHLARSQYGQAKDWVRLAELSFKSDDLFGTLEATREAINLDPQRTESYLLAGLVWQKRGRLTEALRMFDQAARLSPEDPTPLILRGISLERAGRHAAAAQAYKKALKRRPGDSRAQRLLTTVSDHG